MHCYPVVKIPIWLHIKLIIPSCVVQYQQTSLLLSCADDIGTFSAVSCPNLQTHCCEHECAAPAALNLLLFRAATARLDFSALDREVVADQVNKQQQEREVCL